MSKKESMRVYYCTSEDLGQVSLGQEFRLALVGFKQSTP